MDKGAKLKLARRATAGVLLRPRGRFRQKLRSGPLPRSSGPAGPPVENANSVLAIGKNRCKVYLEVLVKGEPVDCLLDTGSEVTIIPWSLVQELLKRPIVAQIRAANGTLIEVLRKVDLRVMLNGEEVTIRGVASDHVADMLLGIDWLETNGAVCHLRRGGLYMKGMVHALKPKNNGGWVHRVIVQETAELPTRCERDVPGRVMYNDLKDPWVTWVTCPGSLWKKFEWHAPTFHPAARGSRARYEFGQLSDHAPARYAAWRFGTS